MTQEEKQLLLKDLCTRLPYGVMITLDGIHPITCTPSIYNAIWLKGNRRFKLYLRPMSSMTEEERMEYLHITLCDVVDCEAWNEVDWLNTHHFDYRGLIERGLAIEAPKGMYN